MTGRTIVIGDVHGCADELDALLRRCEVGRDDRLVCVGDLINRGPDSPGVLARVRAWHGLAVRGNHEDALLQLRADPDLAAGHERRKRLLTLAASLSEDDLRWLAELPLWLRLPEALVVHAGLVPGIPVEAQDPELLTNIRTVDSQGRGHRSAQAGRLWGQLYEGPELVVFGHHARAGLQQHPFAIGLDTGCVYGGRLTACVFPGRELISVPARRAYVSAGGSQG